jgi:hypothetical protein
VEEIRRKILRDQLGLEYDTPDTPEKTGKPGKPGPRKVIRRRR